MMDKFLIIFRGGYYPDELRNDAEFRKKEMARWMNWIEKLTREGRFIAGQPLEPTGRVVSQRGQTITDGPYPEGKEIIGGYFLVRASDLDDAVRLSDDSPDWDYGGIVEVRKIANLLGKDN